MRTLVMLTTIILALAMIYTGPVPGQSAPPTRVCELGLYQCPGHPQIQATWPARCPTCHNVLTRVQAIAAQDSGGQAPAEGDAGQFWDRQVRERGFPNQDFSERPFPRRELPDQDFPERSFPPQGFPSQDFPERQSGERGLRSEEFPEEEFPETDEFRERQFGQRGFWDDEFEREEFPDRQFREPGFPEEEFGQGFPGEEFGEGEFPDEGLFGDEESGRPGFRDEGLDEPGSSDEFDTRGGFVPRE